MLISPLTKYSKENRRIFLSDKSLNLKSDKENVAKHEGNKKICNELGKSKARTHFNLKVSRSEYIYTISFSYRPCIYAESKEKLYILNSKEINNHYFEGRHCPIYDEGIGRVREDFLTVCTKCPFVSYSNDPLSKNNYTLMNKLLISIKTVFDIQTMYNF